MEIRRIHGPSFPQDVMLICSMAMRLVCNNLAITMGFFAVRNCFCGMAEKVSKNPLSSYRKRGDMHI